MKKLRVTVEGKVYEVIAELLGEADPVMAAHASTPCTELAPVKIPIAAATAPKSIGIGSVDIPSPLAGKVVSIDVKVGQEIAAGTQLATVEAMKMNTYLYAPHAGTVSAVLVNEGDGVEEGAILLRLG